MTKNLTLHFQIDPSILEQMWFSDEALFHLSGSVNWHNTRIWVLRSPVQIHKHERDTLKLIIWCTISSPGLIGPFFFHDREGYSVNVNDDNYLRMLQEFSGHFFQNWQLNHFENQLSFLLTKLTTKLTPFTKKVFNLSKEFMPHVL